MVRAFVVSAVALATAALVAACGSEQPAATSGEGSSGFGGSVPSYCATPQEGCPCNVPGTAVECGKVEQRSGDYVTCSAGYRTCGAGTWGPCEGTTLTTKSVAPTLGTLGLAASPSACPDPCDPFCKQYVDTPAGLTLDGGTMTVVDGGLTINPGQTGGGAVSVGFTSNPAGVTNCTPTNRNVVGSGAARSCTPPGLDQCQQDFHCDAFTNTCLWNGGPGYKDPTAGGVDLTIGAPCGDSGNANPAVPLCNRGTGAPLPVGATITLHETTGASPPDACTNLGAPTCTYTMPVPLPPGQCVTLRYCQNTPGAKFVTVNAGIPGQPVASGGPRVAEAAGRCANNSAYSRTDGTPGCGQCTPCNTVITGKVFDPSSTATFQPAASGANNLPLAGVTIFQNAGPLTTLADGVACDTCAALESPYQTGTISGADGSFTLNNVSPGASGTVPITVQSGRWRRKINITSNDLVNGGGIVECAVNPVKDGALRLPRSRAASVDNPGNLQSGVQVDIPKIALVVGDREGLECWMRKIGFSDEMQPRRAAAGGGAARIQLFRTNGARLRDVYGPTCTTANVNTVCNLVANNADRACVQRNDGAGNVYKCEYDPPYNATGGPIRSSTFYTDPNVMNEFTAALLPCDSADIGATPPAAYTSTVRSYLQAGGRMFMDHLTGQEFLMGGGAPLNGVSTWSGAWTTTPAGDPARGVLPILAAPANLNAATTLFYNWMNGVGGLPVVGVGRNLMQSDEPRYGSVNPNTTNTVEWVAGNTTNGWTTPGYTNRNYSLSFSFDTGVNAGSLAVGRDSNAVSCGVAGGTGRVIYNGMHVSQARYTGSPAPVSSAVVYPNNCLGGALSSEEKALEYQFFQLTACELGGAPPPAPPPPPTPLPVVDYYRDFEAPCITGENPIWQYFYWQSVVPTGVTKIEFWAATADTQAALPPPVTYPATPAAATIGVASTTVPTGPLPAPQWGSDADTVDTNLKNDLGVLSKRWLRVYMRFVPDNTTTPYRAPTLSSWRQTYNCMPAE